MTPARDGTVAAPTAQTAAAQAIVAVGKVSVGGRLPFGMAVVVAVIGWRCWGCGSVFFIVRVRVQERRRMWTLIYA